MRSDCKPKRPASLGASVVHNLKKTLDHQQTEFDDFQGMHYYSINSYIRRRYYYLPSDKTDTMLLRYSTRDMYYNEL